MTADVVLERFNKVAKDTLSDDYEWRVWHEPPRFSDFDIIWISISHRDGETCLSPCTFSGDYSLVTEEQIKDVLDSSIEFIEHNRAIATEGMINENATGNI